MNTITILAARLNKLANPWRLKPSAWMNELKLALLREGLRIEDIDKQIIKDMYAIGRDPVLAAAEIADSNAEVISEEPIPVIPEEPVYGIHYLAKQYGKQFPKQSPAVNKK